MANTNMAERMRGGWGIPCRARRRHRRARGLREPCARAIERARAGEGPQAVEAVTLRMHGHAAHDDGRYMDQERLRTFADARDPVERLAARLPARRPRRTRSTRCAQAAADEVAARPGRGRGGAGARPRDARATASTQCHRRNRRNEPDESGRCSRSQIAELFRTRAYIDGAWVDADSGETFEVVNPATGERDRRGARAAAPPRRAARSRPPGRPARRGARRRRRSARTCCARWHDLLLENVDDLALLLTTEQGKPLAEAKAEIAYAASFLEWFGEEAKRAYGDVIPPPADGMRIVVVKEPIGVTAGITPWNFPAAMITRKAAPALAAGCTMVRQAGRADAALRAGAGRARRARGPAAGRALGRHRLGRRRAVIGGEMTSNPIVRKLGFTGSTEVGKLLMAQCAGQVKKVSLELGGNAPFLVFDDCRPRRRDRRRDDVQVPQLRPDLHHREPDVRAGRDPRRVRRALRGRDLAARGRRRHERRRQRRAR